MRKLILTATSIVVTAGMMALATSAQAERRNPHRINWCSKTEGKVDCKYHTKDECRASVEGTSGTCVRSPRNRRK
jgi:hypothetical protein